MTGIHRYRAFGLSIASEAELPELFADPGGAGQPDLRICFDDAAAGRVAAEGALAEVFDFRAGLSGEWMLNLPDVMAITVHAGREIRVSVAPGADGALVRLYVIGSALGMALHQRGALVLHGAGVVGPGGAWVLLGARGVGKSTLAAALGQRGMAVLGDDVTAVWTEALRVWPGSGVFKVTPGTLAALGRSETGLCRVAGGVDKYFLPNRQAGAGPVPLAGVLVLEGEADSPRLEPLAGFDAMVALASHTYRPHYLDLLGRREAHFRQCSEIIARVPVLALRRPAGLGVLAETADLVMETISRNRRDSPQ